MDIDGLAQIIENNREEMIRQFEEMRKHCCQVVEGCQKRLDRMDEKLNEQETSLTRIKSIGIFVAFAWTALVAWFTNRWGS